MDMFTNLCSFCDIYSTWRWRHL